MYSIFVHTELLYEIEVAIVFYFLLGHIRASRTRKKMQGRT